MLGADWLLGIELSLAYYSLGHRWETYKDGGWRQVAHLQAAALIRATADARAYTVMREEQEGRQ